MEIAHCDLVVRSFKFLSKNIAVIGEDLNEALFLLSRAFIGMKQMTLTNLALTRCYQSLILCLEAFH